MLTYESTRVLKQLELRGLRFRKLLHELRIIENEHAQRIVRLELRMLNIGEDDLRGAIKRAEIAREIASIECDIARLQYRQQRLTTRIKQLDSGNIQAEPDIAPVVPMVGWQDLQFPGTFGFSKDVARRASEQLA
jgi:hypothetical protein